MSNLSNRFPVSPIYEKAQQIFFLSRNISNYLTYDLTPLHKNGSENEYIYFTGDIVQQSVSLAPHILKAESQLFSEEKQRYAATVTRLTNMLYKNCDRLEHANSNGKEFLQLLRNELKKFKKLQRTWLLTL